MKAGGYLIKMLKIRFPQQSGNLPIIFPDNKMGENNYYYIYQNKSENNEYDFYVFIEGLNIDEKVFYSNNNIIFFSQEPPSVKTYNNDFLNQFSAVITCHNDMLHSGKVITQQCMPWWINKTYDELKTIKTYEKTKLISIITSDKLITDGHKKRNEFALKLKEHFGDKIDLFGRGINDFNDKWDVIAPYKYHIAIENCSYPNYWTEKLSDAYLAGAYPIYYGCPNLNEYFSDKAFTSIDINDFDKSVETIDKVIKQNTYENSVDEISKAKELILNKYCLFAFLEDFCEKNYKNNLNYKRIKIKPESYFNNRIYKIYKDFKRKPFYFIGNLFKGKIGL